MWLGFSVRLSCLSAHDLPEKTGPAPLAFGPLPQLPDPAGHGQPAGSVLHVETLLTVQRLLYHVIICHVVIFNPIDVIYI